jgi:hypothetical protein
MDEPLSCKLEMLGLKIESPCLEQYVKMIWDIWYKSHPSSILKPATSQLRTH